MDEYIEALSMWLDDGYPHQDDWAESGKVWLMDQHGMTRFEAEIVMADYLAEYE